MNGMLSTQACIVSIVLLSSSLGGVFVYAQEATIDYYFKKYAVEFVYSPAVDTAFPSWASPDAQQENTDLNYWVNDVLPYTQDKNANRYLVYPKSGIVLPILVPNTDDQVKIKNGEVFNHYPYLEQGGLFYYGSAPSEGKGNMVIAAHSSFGKDKAGRYKTIFQALPITRIGDKVFYYEKNSAGSFDLYEYTITDSFETDKTNVSILKQNNSIETLTTYGCYKIGTNDARWVNVATLSKKTAAFVTLTPPKQHTSAPVVPPATTAPTTTPPVALQAVVAPTPPTPTPASTSPVLVTQSVTPTIPSPVNTALQAYLAKKNQTTTPLSGNIQTGTSSPQPEKIHIEEIPVALKIMYGPVLNRLVYHLLQQVQFHKAGIQKLIDQFSEHYQTTTQPAKRHMQGYIIQKLSTYLE